MKGPWVGRLPLEYLSLLAPLRLHDGLMAGRPREATTHEALLWIKGHELTDRLDQQLRQIGPMQRYHIDDQGRLLKPGCTVPEGPMPAIDWRYLADWLPVALPVPASPADHPTAVELVLVGPDHPQWAKAQVPRGPATLWVGSADTWLTYALGLPKTRLDHWLFAIEASQSPALAAVRLTELRTGSGGLNEHEPQALAPLPGLPGRLLVEDHQIAVPAGWGWYPAVPAAVVKRLAGVRSGELLLWLPANDGDQRSSVKQKLPADLWVRARHAALRATQRQRVLTSDQKRGER